MDCAARSLQLLDVLEHLPPTLLRQSFWPVLLTSERSGFRLVSQPSRRLADQLTKDFHFNFVHWPGPRACEELPFPQVQLVGMVLGLQEHVETLTLDNTEDEASVVEGLRLGGPGCRRTTQLDVDDSSGLTGVSGAAVARACPALRTLLVSSSHEPSFEERMQGSFVAALHSLQHLTRVEFGNAAMDAALTAALATLPALQTLKIAGADTIELAALPHLAALTGLRELRLKAALLAEPAALHALACLRSLTQLTRLRVRCDVYNPDRPVASDAAVDVANAALAQLGTLRHLRSLRVSDMLWWVDEVGFAGLRQMSCLTQLHLHTGILMHSHAPRGALPQLRELHLHEVSGEELVSTLHALSPVRHLTQLTVRIALDLAATAETWAVDLAALRQSACYLAEAPPELRLDLTILAEQGADEGDVADGDVAEGHVAGALAAMAALRPRLRRLKVHSFSVLQLKSLGAVLACYTCLTKLRMWDCGLDADTVIGIAQHALALRELEVSTRGQGATPLLALALVSTRLHPLLVKWTPLALHDLAAIEAVLRALDKHGVVSVSATYTRMGDAEDA